MLACQEYNDHLHGLGYQAYIKKTIISAIFIGESISLRLRCDGSIKEEIICINGTTLRARGTQKRTLDQ